MEKITPRLFSSRFYAAMAVALCVALLITHTGALSNIDRAYGDLWHRLSGTRFVPAHTVLIAVDEESLAKYPNDPLAFWAPLFARAMDTLHKAGASVIGIDFLMSITPENWLTQLNLAKDDALKQYDRAFRQELNAGLTVLAGTVVRGENGKHDSLLLPHIDYLVSLPGANLARSIGLANLEVDTDGVVRRFAIAPSAKLPAEISKDAPTLSLAALLAVRARGLDINAAKWEIGEQSFEGATRAPITFSGPPGSFPRVSFHKLLEKNALNDPAVQALKGKVVIIGGDYLGMNDVHASPYSSSFAGPAGTVVAAMPGPELQANIVETILSGRTTSPMPGVAQFAIHAMLISMVIFLCVRLTPWTGLLVVLVGCALAMGISYFAFSQFLLFSAAPLQLGLISGFFLVLGSRLTGEEREKQRIRTMFGGYVSDDVVQLLLSRDQALELSGQSMYITVLFTDIRNFTAISEQLTAAETVEFLNAYFKRVVEAIHAEGGRVDKYIGDAVMAEFGAPYPFKDHAARALRAANNIRTVASEFKDWMQERFPNRVIPSFAVGVGVHTGNAVVGNLGAPSRMEYTAVGDMVNVAAHIEAATKTLNCVIVASTDTLNAAGNIVTTGRQSRIQVKGRIEPIEVAEVLGINL